jgi:hypothetical protein
MLNAPFTCSAHWRRLARPLPLTPAEGPSTRISGGLPPFRRNG